MRPPYPDCIIELYTRVRAGEISLKAALRQLDGVPDAEFARKSKAAQTRFRAILRLAQARPELFDRITAFLDEIDREPPRAGS